MSHKQDFRRFLQNEFLRRVSSNSRYSIRAFANAMQVSDSALSQILRGKRPLTNKMIIRLGKKCGMGPGEIDTFLSCKPSTRLKSSSEMELQQLNLDTFAIISDWYHDAILELTKLDHFESNPKWIAQKLGIRVSEVRLAIERLVRLGLLKESKGKWQSHLVASTTVRGNFTAAALCKYQKQLLNLSEQAIETVPFEKRTHSSFMFPIHSSDIDRAKEAIKRFRRQFSGMVRSSRRPDQINVLQISFFPVSENRQ